MNDKLVDIPDYDGLYAITKKGEVWSYPKQWIIGPNKGVGGHNGKFMKLSFAGRKTKQYRSVLLVGKDGQHKRWYVHRLVALTYLPNPNNLPCINHIDGDRLNNNVDNLEWCTQSHNLRRAIAMGLRKYGKLSHNAICSCFICRPYNRRPKHDL